MTICQFKISDFLQGGIGHVQQFLAGRLEQYLNFVAGEEFGNDSGTEGRVLDPVARGKRVGTIPQLSAAFSADASRLLAGIESSCFPRFMAIDIRGKRQDEGGKAVSSGTVTGPGGNLGTGIGDHQPIFGPRGGHIHETPFFLQIVGVVVSPGRWKFPFHGPDHKDHGPLQPLGGVDRGEGQFLISGFPGISAVLPGGSRTRSSRKARSFPYRSAIGTSCSSSFSRLG